MSARLKSGFWVSAYLKQCAVQHISAYLRRRGAEDAGAIFIVADHLNGHASLFGPAPQSELDDTQQRSFICLVERKCTLDIESRLEKEIRFDPDLWIIDVESQQNIYLP